MERFAERACRPEWRFSHLTILENVGLVQIWLFSGNSTDDERALTVQGSQRGASASASDAGKALVAEHL